MPQRYKAGFMSATKPTANTTTANGIWLLSDALQQIQAAQWPTAYNLPSGGVYVWGSPNSGTSYPATVDILTNTGVIGGEYTSVGTSRWALGGANYGYDKAIVAFGWTTAAQNIANLISNTGVVAANSTGVGTARWFTAGATYGGNLAIFGYGQTTSSSTSGTAVSNKVSSTGVVAGDTAGVGTARGRLAATAFGAGQAIFGFGYSTGGLRVGMTNIVSTAGVVASDTAAVGTARQDLSAGPYGGNKGIFGMGLNASGSAIITNLVSNTGVIASDTTNTGITNRGSYAVSPYGYDKAQLFGGATNLSTYNNITNTGVIGSDQTTTGVTGRGYLCGAGIGQ